MRQDRKSTLDEQKKQSAQINTQKTKEEDKSLQNSASALNLELDNKDVVKGKSYYAFKNIDRHPGEDADSVTAAAEEGAESEWIRELSADPMQRIIRWKAPWYRNHQSRR